MARLVLVKVGDGYYSDVTLDDVTGMRRMALLESLAATRAFEVELRDVPLSKCAVHVRASEAKTAPSADVAARVLEDALTLGDLFPADLEGAPAAGNLYIHVRLPPSVVAGAGAGGGAAAAAGGAGGEGFASLQATLGELATSLAALSTLPDKVASLIAKVDELKEGSDSFSIVSPTGQQYENIVDSQISGLLQRFCGLVDAKGRRGISDTDTAGEGLQWDGRFSVVTDTAWVAPPFNHQFVVYGNHSSYRQPAVVELRGLSPTKSFLPAQYFAVAEYTAHSEWWRDIFDESKRRIRHGLLSRLNERLAKCLKRFHEAGNPLTEDATLVVAVVAVVSPMDCKANVEAALCKPDCPYTHLRSMMDAGRFIHITVPSVVQMRSPTACVAH